MREILAQQVPLVAQPFEHPHVRELRAMGELLDAHPELSEWVAAQRCGDGCERPRIPP